MKVNGQLKNAQLELRSEEKDERTKGEITYDTNCGQMAVDNGQAVHRVQDNRDMPVGSVIMWMSGAVAPDPDRWRSLHASSSGQTILSKEDYPELYAVLGDAYGATNTHFFLPNMNGQFTRGVDMAIGDGSRGSKDRGPRDNRPDGVTGFGTPGTTQLDGIPQHQHVNASLAETAIINYASGPNQLTNIAQRPGTVGSSGVIGSLTQLSILPSGLLADEVRPCNIAVLYYMKVK